MKITIEYNPSISKPAKAYIRYEVTPSMTSYDGDSNQYSMSYCIEKLEEEKELFNQDIEVLNKLAQSSVDYIEF